MKQKGASVPSGAECLELMQQSPGQQAKHEDAATQPRPRAQSPAALFLEQGALTLGACWTPA